MIKIEYLADFSEYRKTVIDWHHEQWLSLMPDYPQKEWDDLITLDKNVLPVTLIAIELFDVGAPEVTGMVTLRKSSHSAFLESSIECCSLFVSEKERGRGIGGMLLRKLYTVAMGMGYQSVYTCITDTQKWFEKKGWTEIPAGLSGVDQRFAIMTRDIGISPVIQEK